jgi:DNA end-binding protein Ku
MIMAAHRAQWKGHIKIGEISCGVGLYTAASTSDRISFRTINKATGNPVRREFVDSETEETVEREKQVKGFEIESGEYIMIDPEEVTAVIPESDKMLDIEAFLPSSEVDDVYFDKPYYLVPTDDVAEDSFAGLRDAMREADVTAIARTVLFRRMRTVLIRAHGRRPYWKGYLKLSLVTCPVNMSPATSESEKVRFHTLNKETGNRVVSQYIDSVTGKPVNGRERGEGLRPRRERLRDPDGRRPRPGGARHRENDRHREVRSGAESIEWVYLEKPHYLMPDDAVGNEAFAVIRDAMKADKVVGISKLVVGRREKAVVLQPRDEGIVLWSLRFGDEVRPEEAYFEDIDDEADPDLVPLVQQLIKKKTKRWSPDMVSDPIQESLLKLIEEKKKALKPKKKTAKAKGRGPGLQRHQHHGRPAHFHPSRLPAGRPEVQATLYRRAPAFPVRPQHRLAGAVRG